MSPTTERPPASALGAYRAGYAEGYALGLGRPCPVLCRAGDRAADDPRIRAAGWRQGMLDAQPKVRKP